MITVKDADGFALALGKDLWADRAVAFPHFGFGVDSPDEARALRRRLVSDGVELVEDEDAQAYVGFKCLDPDRHVIEVSRET